MWERMVGVELSTVTPVTRQPSTSLRRSRSRGESGVMMARSKAVNVQRRLGQPRAEGADDLLQLLVELLRRAGEGRAPGLRGGGLGRELGQIDGQDRAVLHDHAAADHHRMHAAAILDMA